MKLSVSDHLSLTSRVVAYGSSICYCNSSVERKLSLLHTTALRLPRLRLFRRQYSDIVWLATSFARLCISSSRSKVTCTLILRKLKWLLSRFVFTCSRCSFGTLFQRVNEVERTDNIMDLFLSGGLIHVSIEFIVPCSVDSSILDCLSAENAAKLFNSSFHIFF